MAQGQRSTPPLGYVGMARATAITGKTDETLAKWFRAGEIPGAIQRKPRDPIYFTEAGLRLALGITTDQDAVA